MIAADLVFALSAHILARCQPKESQTLREGYVEGSTRADSLTPPILSFYEFVIFWFHLPAHFQIPLPVQRLSIFSILGHERAKKLSIGVHGFAENRENRQPRPGRGQARLARAGEGSNHICQRSGRVDLP